ncbi:jg9818 [Pararge aegeria aegeria]|uniref:Jg9818 protein n=1 Tax=Pararge aegeria aegeria TaxID=348720 RepID=A0A8S4RJC2_9NEOP|nr:jg9818 [Pararge aegeria aegeria]
MRSGSCTTRTCEKGCGQRPVRLHRLAKPGLTLNKVMLCVWWDWKGIIHYEQLPPGTIDFELHCEQLMRLKQEVGKKRPELINRRGVVFHHDNARPHTSSATQQKLRELGWEVLMHSDFHLFRSLQNFLGSDRLTSREDCQNYMSRFCDQKPQNIFSNKI